MTCHQIDLVDQPQKPMKSARADLCTIQDVLDAHLLLEKRDFTVSAVELRGRSDAAEIIVVSDDPKSPDHYKSLIPAALKVVHATVEVQRFE